jgi:hypothetical protein
VHLHFLRFLFCISICTIYGNCQIEPNCHCPSNNCRGELLIEADLLVWCPCEKGLDRCVPKEITNTIASDGKVLSVFKESGSAPKFKWSPGYRVSLGYASSQFCLNTKLVWSHFDSSSHHSEKENNFKWRLQFNTVDALASYRFESCDCLTFSPFLGIRAAKIDQNIHLNNFVFNPVHNKDSQKFSGIGPLIGLETHFKIGCNLSVFANVALSWLYGECKIKFDHLSEFDDGTNLYKVKKHFHSNQYVTDTCIGIKWNTTICKRDVFIKLALEHHHYFDYNYLSDGDLSLSGGSASIGFDF